MDPALRPVRSLVALYAGCGYTIIVLFTLLAGLKGEAARAQSLAQPRQ